MRAAATWLFLWDFHGRISFTKFYNLHHVHHVHPHLCFQQLTMISPICNVHPNVHHVHLSEGIKRLVPHKSHSVLTYKWDLSL